MRHFKFNKIIRDKLPSIISKGGVDVIYKNIKGKDLIEKLKEKLKEELFEVENALSKEQMLEELGDLMEVIHGMAKALGSDFEEVESIRQKKYEKRGGFENGIFVDKVSLSDDSPMIFFYLDQPDKYPEIKGE